MTLVSGTNQNEEHRRRIDRGRVELTPSGILCQRSADHRTDGNTDAHGTDYYALIHRDFVKWNRVSDDGECSLC